ncbi:hypothetical protein, partial [Pseudoxanthomonas sp. KAs_5_3]|uniref:hypothetical protein n=1 Tax=Pseudoxanthomonas sp. KAs_5_3 TaxID=2067658 RepID=UPI0018EB146A
KRGELRKFTYNIGPNLAIHSVSVLRPHLLLAAFSLLLLCAGAQAQDQPAPIRFLLTFDDGPAAAVNDNPTVHILDVLARKNIK